MVCRLVCAWERKAAKEPLSDVGSDDVFEGGDKQGLHFNAIFSALADSLQPFLEDDVKPQNAAQPDTRLRTLPSR